MRQAVLFTGRIPVPTEVIPPLRGEVLASDVWKIAPCRWASDSGAVFGAAFRG